MGERDPKYWKKIMYSTVWAKHKKEVLKLQLKLEEKLEL